MSWPRSLPPRNIAADGNQLTMELMQRLAQKHGMVCLLRGKALCGGERQRQAQ